MTDERLKEILQESMAATMNDYAQDLEDARELLARACEWMSANPWAAQDQLQDDMYKFLEKMALKEMSGELE